MLSTYNIFIRSLRILFRVCVKKAITKQPNWRTHLLMLSDAVLRQEEYRMWQRSTAPVTHDTEEAEVQGRETSGGFGNGKLYRPQVSDAQALHVSYPLLHAGQRYGLFMPR